MEIKFIDPWMAQLAALVLAIVLIALLFFRVRARKLSLFALIVRGLAAACVAVALGLPYLENKTESSQAILLVDISDSNDIAVAQELLDETKALRDGGVELGVLPFAKNSGVTNFNNETLSSFSRLKQDHTSLDIGETDLERALNTVREGGPASVLLISDGFETRGRVASVIPLLTSGGSRVFPLLPENTAGAGKSLKISHLHAPLVAPSEKSVEVRVAVTNTSDQLEGGILQVLHDGKEIYSKEVEVKPGEEALFIAQSDPSKEGIKEIKAVLKPHSKNFNPSSALVYLSSREREKILLVSGNYDDQRFLKPLYENKAFQLKTITGRSEAWPQLSEFSVVIFNNIAVNELPRGMAATVESYVQNGGAFLMIGGNHSFGLGGYLNTSIEDVLPVALVPPQSVEKRLNVAVQLVIDKSKSMATGGRIEFAKEAAIAVVDNLKDEDFVGVMGFDENPFVVIRISPVASVRADAVKRIGRLFPNFGTSLVGAMDEARRDLMRVKAGRKHMIILTDGQITDAPAHYYYELVKQVRFLGVTVSTVLLGGESDGGMLREMSNLGGGAFYKTNDPRSLPKIFIDDVKVASGERTLKEQTDYNVELGPGELRSTEIRNYPDVRGYVQTKPKPKANLELVVRGRDTSEPLLASWSYGKGRSAAFTSDANGRWSGQWVPWSRFQEFWSSIVESLRPENMEKESDLPFDLVYYYESGRLYFDLSIFSSSYSGNVRAEISLPSGEKRMIDLVSSAPGRFKGELSNPTAGKYEVRTTVGSQALTAVAFSLSGELFGEKKGQGFNVPLLRNLAKETNGKINPTLEDLKQQVYTSITKNDLTPWFLIAALIFVIFEILWREVFMRFRFFNIFPRRIARARS